MPKTTALTCIGVKEVMIAARSCPSVARKRISDLRPTISGASSPAGLAGGTYCAPSVTGSVARARDIGSLSGLGRFRREGLGDVLVLLEPEAVLLKGGELRGIERRHGLSGGRGTLLYGRGARDGMLWGEVPAGVLTGHSTPPCSQAERGSPWHCPGSSRPPDE